MAKNDHVVCVPPLRGRNMFIALKGEGSSRLLYLSIDTKKSPTRGWGLKLLD